MNAFDQLSKGLANGGISRRDGLKLALGGAAFAAVSALGIGTATAKSFDDLCAHTSGNICNHHTNCTKNSNCFCFQHIGQRDDATFCGCNVNCAYAYTKTCRNNAQCPANTLCAVNTGVCGCDDSTRGICIKKCTGKFANCTFNAA